MISDRLTVRLDQEEAAALDHLCTIDKRPPKHYLRWLVMQEAQRRGLLPKMNDCTVPNLAAETGAIVAANL